MDVDMTDWSTAAGLAAKAGYCPDGSVGEIGVAWSAALCRDEVIEVIRAARATDPTSREWEEAVAQPALGLIEKMKLLSDGWSSGLAGFFVAWWSAALSFALLAINPPYTEGMDAALGWSAGSHRSVFLFLAAILAAIPFLAAMNIAETSTWCDTLMDELNDARTNHGPDSHLKIQWLESTLKQLVRPPSRLRIVSIGIAL